MPAVRARSIHRAALGVAIASIFASAPVVLVGIALPYIPQAAGEPFTLRDMLVAVASIVPLSLIGIVLFGWMALPLAIPSGYLWAAVLRAVFRERLQTLAPDMFAPRAAA
jgi:hypothetical protein